MTRILFISHSAGGSGSERSLLEIIKAVDKDKFKVFVLYPFFGGDYFKEEITRIKNIEIFSLNYKQIPNRNTSFVKLFANGLSQILNTIRVVILIKRNNIDVVVSNTNTVIVGALSGRVSRVKHVWCLHEQMPTDGILPLISAKRYERFINNHSHLIFFNSKWLMESYKGVDRANAHVVSNAFSDFLPGILKRRSLDTGNVITLGVVGTIAENKNQIIAVEVVQLLKQMNFNVQLLIAGKVSDVKYRASIQATIDKFNLASKIQICDFESDISGIFKKIDILLVPSKIESFGRVVVEGLHSGCFVIASAVGGIPEIITHNVNGVLVDNICADGFTAALIELLRNKILRDKLIANGRKSVSEYFTDTPVKQFEKLVLALGN